MSKEQVPSWMIAQALCCLRVCQIVKDEKTGEEDVLPLDNFRILRRTRNDHRYFVQFRPWFCRKTAYLSIGRLQASVSGMETLEDGKWKAGVHLFVEGQWEVDVDLPAYTIPDQPVILDFSVETRDPETGLAEVRTLCTEAEFREELAKHRPDEDEIERYVTLAYANKAAEQQE